MAAPFGFPIPAPNAGAFTDGEQALSAVTPLNSAPAYATYYLSRYFDFEGGEYTIKAVCQTAAQFYSARTLNNGRLLFRMSDVDQVATGTIYIPRGRQRFDILLSSTQLAGGRVYVAFSLYQRGRLVYASTPSGWEASTSPIPDSAVPSIGDRRLAMPVFSVLPNWRGGVTERLEWNTEIMAAETDDEQRRSLRQWPSRMIEASFDRGEIARARLDQFFSNSGMNEVLVPLWFEQFRVAGALQQTVQFPATTLQFREFRAGQLVFVTDKNPNIYELLTIASHDLDADTITFTQAPQNAWPLGSRIIPLRPARVLETSRMSNLTDQVGSIQARFMLTQPDTYFEASWGTCTQLFTFRPNWASPVDVSYARNTFTLDTGVMDADVTDVSEQTRIITQGRLMLRGRSRTWAYRQFLYAARGRAVRFWMPTQMTDLPPSVIPGGTQFSIRNVGFAEYNRKRQDARTTIVITFKDNRFPLYRTVADVIDLGDTEQIYLNAGIPPLVTSEIDRISFIMPARFDQDAFEFRHPVDDSAVVETNFLVRSNDLDEMPPIECVVTSRPYPVVAIESMNFSMQLTGATLRELNYPVESMDFSLDLTAGNLRSLLQQIENYDAEALDFALNFLSGELRNLLLQYNEYAVESIDFALTLTGANLDEALIRYDRYAAEEIDFSMLFTGGTLQ